MTSVADHQQQHQQHQQPQNDPEHPEPPAKKRRGGRRSSNPEISAEERKRVRILKNRESAMRSLAKKAEYSAKLQTLEKDAIAANKATGDSLQKLIATAITLKSTLDKVPEDVSSLIAEAEKSINNATKALSEDRDPPPSPPKPAAPPDSASPASAATAAATASSPNAANAATTATASSAATAATTTPAAATPAAPSATTAEDSGNQ